MEIGTPSFGNRVEINREVWEADRIILTGEIMYLLIAGYSGGRKVLVPGVAGFRTTTFNHRMIFDPNCRPRKLDGNPAHEDLLEACRMVELDFIVNVVLRPGGDPSFWVTLPGAQIAEAVASGSQPRCNCGSHTKTMGRRRPTTPERKRRLKH